MDKTFANALERVNQKYPFQIAPISGGKRYLIDKNHLASQLAIFLTGPDYRINGKSDKNNYKSIKITSHALKKGNHLIGFAIDLVDFTPTLRKNVINELKRILGNDNIHTLEAQGDIPHIEYYPNNKRVEMDFKDKKLVKILDNIISKRSAILLKNTNKIHGKADNNNLDDNTKKSLETLFIQSQKDIDALNLGYSIER